MRQNLDDMHPGRVLFEEYLQPRGITQNRIARDLGVPPRRINEIILGKRSITPDTALRLARYLGTSAKYWLNLQAEFDIEKTRGRLGASLDHIEAAGRRAQVVGTPRAMAASSALD